MLHLDEYIDSSSIDFAKNNVPQLLHDPTSSPSSY